VKRINSLVVSTLLLSILLGASVFRATAQEPEPIVHAVLFYSPSCSHCQYVITEVLPPLMQQYGSQLQIIGFDVSQEQGQAMFYAALERYGLEQAGVPLLVIDNITLVGSQEIPDHLPGLIESYLKLGGVAWPDVPGLREMLIGAALTATAEAAAPSQSPSQVVTPAPGLSGVQPEELGWQQRFATDRTANTIAVVVLVLMIAAVVWALIRFRRAAGPSIRDKALAWLIPALCVLGLIAAGYLAYIETTNTGAVCGPIGDCNTVQQSRYSHLFGVLSIGVFGLIGYALIVVAWAWARFGKGRAASRATIALFVLSLLGTLFSIYLTFLEPFVIGATCAWCLTSAALMAVLMLLSAGAAGRALWPSRSAEHQRARKAPSSARSR
jgi:uncharacterized membrane protein